MAASKSEREFHRKTAAACFNRAWDFLDKKGRSDSDDLEMLGLAHASRFHWGVVGSARNRAVGDWQLSRVYADLGQPRLALLYAKSSLDTCDRNNLTSIVHTANEAMARAYAVSLDFVRAEKYMRKARQQLDALKLGRDDRKVYLDQQRQTEKLIEGLCAHGERAPRAD